MKKEEMEEREKQIKKLREKGMLQREIAKEAGVSELTVRHYLNPEARKRKNERQKTRMSKNPEKHRKYNRDYQRKRYHEDEDFRRMKLDAAGKWEKDNRDHLNKYRRERSKKLKANK